MKKLLLGTILLVLALVFPITSMAMGRVDVSMGIPLPPAIVFSAPPQVVVIPETNVYAVPDVDVDIFFYGGWWWRPWEGRWYRSQNYNSGWSHYQNVPFFYREVPSGWRNDYRARRWKGHQWDHQRIPQEQVQRNWSNWERDRHWEQNTWGVRYPDPQKDYQGQNNQVQEQQRPQSRDAGEPQQSQPQHGKSDRRGKKN